MVFCLLKASLTIILACLNSATYAYPSSARSTAPETKRATSYSNPFPDVTGLNLVPDALHPYVNPTKSDQRGPCPGLNALANREFATSLSVDLNADLLLNQRRLHSTRWYSAL